MDGGFWYFFWCCWFFCCCCFYDFLFDNLYVLPDFTVLIDFGVLCGNYFSDFPSSYFVCSSMCLILYLSFCMSDFMVYLVFMRLRESASTDSLIYWSLCLSLCYTWSIMILLLMYLISLFSMNFTLIIFFYCHRCLWFFCFFFCFQFFPLSAFAVFTAFGVYYRSDFYECSSLDMVL